MGWAAFVVGNIPFSMRAGAVKPVVEYGLAPRGMDGIKKIGANEVKAQMHWARNMLHSLGK